AADLALHFIRAVRDAAEHAAEETAGDPGGRAEGTDLRRLARRHVAVRTFLAVELELVPAIGGKVFVVTGERDARHAGHYHRLSMSRQHATAATLCVVLVLAFTWPLLPNLGRAVAEPGER